MDPPATRTVADGLKVPPSMDLQQGVPIMGPGGYDVRFSYWA